MTDFEYLRACRTPFPTADYACSRVLLVGEDNPYGSTPEWALYCAPEGCAGQRLQARILGLRPDVYLSIWRTNLCAGGWSMKAAKARADDLFSTYLGSWRTIVMLGRKVADAFARATGKAVPPFGQSRHVVHFSEYTNAVRTLVSLPHPSGRNTIWNDPRRVIDARMLLAEVAPDVPWGELHTPATEAP